MVSGTLGDIDGESDAGLATVCFWEGLCVDAEDRDDGETLKSCTLDTKPLGETEGLGANAAESIPAEAIGRITISASAKSEIA